jgi:hypothetical protein
LGTQRSTRVRLRTYVASRSGATAPGINQTLPIGSHALIGYEH